MTPKEKAINLMEQFSDVQWIEENRETIKVKWLQGDELKQCALISVDEILDLLDDMCGVEFFYINFYREVKKEIEAL